MCHVAVEGSANLAEDGEGEVPLAALDPADIRAVDLRLVGQVLLRPAE